MIRNKHNKLVIGVSAPSFSGKDTLCRLLIEKFAEKHIGARQASLAEVLKNEINPYLIHTYGIDVWNCTPEQKTKIRGELVEYGRKHRESSAGVWWTNKVEEQFDKIKEPIIIVPDVRYQDDRFPHDECWWVQEKNNGILIHLSRYWFENGEKKYVAPANADEEKFDPICKARADICIELETQDINKLPQDPIVNQLFETLYGIYTEL